MGDDFIEINEEKRQRKNYTRSVGMKLWQEHTKNRNVQFIKESNSIINFKHAGCEYYYTVITHLIRKKGEKKGAHIKYFKWRNEFIVDEGLPMSDEEARIHLGSVGYVALFGKDDYIARFGNEDYEARFGSGKISIDSDIEK